MATKTPIRYSWNCVPLNPWHQYLDKRGMSSLKFTSLGDRIEAPPATLLKKRLWHRCFLVNFAKSLRTPFLQNTSGGCFSQMQTRKKGFVLKIKIWLRFSHQTQSAYSNKLIQEQLLLCFQHSTSLLITFD